MQCIILAIILLNINYTYSTLHIINYIPKYQYNWCINETSLLVQKSYIQYYSISILQYIWYGLK